MGLLLAWALVCQGQSSYHTQAQEYLPVGSLVGDQVQAAVALSAGSGFLVWEDNMTDGDGSAIVARRLGPNQAGLYGSFRVNQAGTKDQQKPQVALLKDGGAVIVWQGNQTGDWNIYAAIIASNGTLTAGDLLVNDYTANDQITPAVATLPGGNVVVVWGSFEQDGSFQGVYGRILTPAGEKLGAEFQVHTSTYFNQRTPAVAALNNGGFVVVWVSEHQSYGPAVRAEIYGQMFSASGQAIGAEFQVNTAQKVCANPAITALGGGGFMVVWGQKGPVNKSAGPDEPENGWDIFGRNFLASAKPVQRDAVRLNTCTYGDQFAPKVAANGGDVLAVWTSLGQDGSVEGIYGQLLSEAGVFSGPEIQVNTTTLSQQMQPALGGDGEQRFLAVWSSFAGGLESFDLMGQRFERVSAPLSAPAAPFVVAISQSRLSVAWPELDGYNVSAWEVYMDGAATPVVVASNSWTANGLAAGSAHTFQVAYRLGDGRVSPKSAPATATTWGEDNNYDGLPDDWQTLYWGASMAAWAAGNADSDGDGVSNLQEFLAGTNPRDPASVLKAQLAASPQGTRLTWNTQPGQIYRVQVSTNFGVWTTVETARLAATNVDSIAVDGSRTASFYRIIRVR